jgi:hypothetical protein
MTESRMFFICEACGSEVYRWASSDFPGEYAEWVDMNRDKATGKAMCFECRAAVNQMRIALSTVLAGDGGRNGLL